MLLEVDKENNIGYNTGFTAVKIIDEIGNGDSVLINENYYHYKFVNSGIKDGAMRQATKMVAEAITYSKEIKEKLQ